LQHLRLATAGFDSTPWLFCIWVASACYFEPTAVFDIESRPWSVAQLLGLRRVPSARAHRRNWEYHTILV